MSVGPARLREDADVIRRGCIAKGEDPALVDQALVVDAQRRDLLGKADAMRGQRNQISESIGLAIRGGAAADAPQVAQLREQSTWIGAEIAGVDARLAEVTAKLDELLYRIPNPPDPGVPVGGEEASLIVRTWGEPLTPHEEPQHEDREAWVRRPHWESAAELGIIDLEAGAKVTGSGFPLYRGAGSALQRALIDFFLDLHTREHGMTEVCPPALVNEASARRTGQIPHKEDQMYGVTRDDLYLGPT
jgi:seryl-tRNA synthetase